MKTYYRMAVKNIKTGKRDTYVSERQGTAPTGWKCTGVCGKFEMPQCVSFDFAWQARRFAEKA